MASKVFVLGRPGSGKSAAVRYLFDSIKRQKKSSVIKFNDYDILYKMFLEDTEHKQFLPTANGGFDILDPSVREEAQFVLEQKVQEALLLQKEETIVIIEFGRPDYKESFALFSTAFLEDAHYLFIAADLGTCLKRTQERFIRKKTADDYFLAEHIMLGRYSCPYVPPHINGEAINIVENVSDDVVQLNRELEAFAQQLVEQEELKGKFIQASDGQKMHITQKSFVLV